MVGWLRWSEVPLWRPRVRTVPVRGLSLLVVDLPPGRPDRRAVQGGKLLRRRGVRRAVLCPGLGEEDRLRALGLEPVDPLPLCRAAGAKLALALLEPIPVRLRRAALRGDRAGPEALGLARELCPRVGALELDFCRGEEELRAHLRALYGAACLHLGQGPSPQVSVELSPCPAPAGRALRLWGRPELRGLTLSGPERVPPGLEPLPFLELLWETGRLELSELRAEADRLE